MSSNTGVSAIRVNDAGEPVCENFGGEAFKYDNGKPPIGLIPHSALIEESLVLGYGCEKYGPHQWRGGMEWSRLINAAFRHLSAFNAGEDLDPETGYCHLAHARANLGFLIEYMTTHPELDDRYGG